MPYTDDEVLIGELMEKTSELERKLSKCMEERDRVLSMLRRLVEALPLENGDGEIADAEWLLNESRNWK